MTETELIIDTDETLMLRYQSGDAGAFDVLYARHRGGLFRFIQRQCRNAFEGEELFQEVWINVIQARESYTVQAQFRTWLFTLAHHRLIDYFRKHRMVDAASFSLSDSADDEVNAELPASRISEPDVIAQSREQGKAILKLLGELPALQREVFLLHEEAGLSVEEIAAATGATFEAVKSRLRYAFAKLREGLQEYA